MKKKMNKKGFTIIELLAVIVILALIAVIATPILTNVIEKSKRGAAERSGELYLKEVRTAMGTEKMNGKEMKGKYFINPSGHLCPEEAGANCSEDKQIIIDMVGDRPTSGTIVIDNGKIQEKGTELTFDNKYNLLYDQEKGSTTVVIYYELGTAYEIDPGDGIKRVFYVLEDGDKTELTKYNGTVHYETDKIGTAGRGEVSLIMAENIGDTGIKWNEISGNNAKNADKARPYLESQTTEKGWTVEVNLPTYAQIHDASFTTTPASYPYSPLKDWLVANLNAAADDGLPQGYWTGTAYSGGTDSAWHVQKVQKLSNGNTAYKSYRDGNLSRYYVNYNATAQEHVLGVRPVITVDKKVLEELDPM